MGLVLKLQALKEDSENTNIAFSGSSCVAASC